MVWLKFSSDFTSQVEILVGVPLTQRQGDSWPHMLNA
jgi:hypothetical protein